MKRLPIILLAIAGCTQTREQMEIGGMGLWRDRAGQYWGFQSPTPGGEYEWIVIMQESEWMLDGYEGNE